MTCLKGTSSPAQTPLVSSVFPQPNSPIRAIMLPASNLFPSFLPKLKVTAGRLLNNVYESIRGHSLPTRKLSQIRNISPVYSCPAFGISKRQTAVMNYLSPPAGHSRRHISQGTSLPSSSTMVVLLERQSDKIKKIANFFIFSSFLNSFKFP